MTKKRDRLTAIDNSYFQLHQFFAVLQKLSELKKFKNMKKILLNGLFLLVAIATVQAQTDDKKQIETLITDLYFEGWMTGDTTKIGKAMHATCHLKFFRDSTFSDISRADYLSRFKPRAKEVGTEGRIVSLDITGNIASAKCELETPKALFTDYFNLIKTNDGWFIVDKVSTRVDK